MIVEAGNGSGNGGVSMVKPIPKSTLKAVNARFETQRARYVHLNRLGYSQERIAAAYGVSKKTVWQAINSWSVPREVARLTAPAQSGPKRRKGVAKKK